MGISLKGPNYLKPTDLVPNLYMYLGSEEMEHLFTSLLWGFKIRDGGCLG